MGCSKRVCVTKPMFSFCKLPKLVAFLTTSITPKPQFAGHDRPLLNAKAGRRPRGGVCSGQERPLPDQTQQPIGRFDQDVSVGCLSQPLSSILSPPSRRAEGGHGLQ